MEKQCYETLKKMAVSFEKMSNSIAVISDVIKRQEPSKLMQVLTTMGVVASIFGVIAVFDIIKNWFGD